MILNPLPLYCVMGAMKIFTCLFLRPRTTSQVSTRNEGLPSEMVRTPLCADLRPPRSRTFSATVNDCAMFVKPLRYASEPILVFTAARSEVSPWAKMASLMVPSARIFPLPNYTTPTFMASAPKYMPTYFSMSFTAKALTIFHPLSMREPLASSAMTRSCLAMHISSPLHL